MSAYDLYLDLPQFIQDSHADCVDDFMESITRKLGADDAALADGMSDALYDPRTRSRIIASVRSGDLIEAMRVMHDHATTTYINEAAEVAAEKEFH